MAMLVARCCDGECLTVDTSLEDDACGAGMSQLGKVVVGAFGSVAVQTLGGAQRA